MAKYNKIDIILSDGQRKELQNTISKGTCKAAEIRRANALLMADQAGGRKKKTDSDIAASLGISRQSVINIKKNFLQRSSGTDSTMGIKRKRRETPPVMPKCTGDVEAKIVAITCSAPPEGRNRWTLRLISERIVELEILSAISHTQIGHILKKTGTSLT